MTRRILWMTAAALLACAGCNKRNENPPPSPTSTGSAAPAAAGSGSAAPAAPAAGSAAPAAPAAGSGSAAASVDVPTEQDFEADAASKITDKNVEAEVGALEKQLAPDPTTK